MVEWDDELLQEAAAIKATIDARCAGERTEEALGFLFALVLATLKRLDRKLEAQSHE